MSHDTMLNYYSNNFHALFYKDNIGIANRFTLSDFETMLPYERDIYMTLMRQKIESMKND